MKIVVIGGAGRIGSRLVDALRGRDHWVVAASRASGVGTTTGQGLADALRGAEVVIDVSNVPSFDGDDALPFFSTAGRNLLAAAKSAGVSHHIALSIVGADRLANSDYFYAKLLQEELVQDSGIPFTILRSTQFFEFISDVVQQGDDQMIAISPAYVQPIAASDVAKALADIALAPPRSSILEIAGPERLRLTDVATEIATAFEDGRQIVSDHRFRYFGAELADQSLLPAAAAQFATATFDDWLRRSLQPQWALAASD